MLPAPRDINVNLCESQCVVESQARERQQQRGVWAVDQRRPRQEVAPPDGETLLAIMTDISIKYT